MLAKLHQNDPLEGTVDNEIVAVMRKEGWIVRGRTVEALFLDE